MILCKEMHKKSKLNEVDSIIYVLWLWYNELLILTKYLADSICLEQRAHTHLISLIDSLFYSDGKEEIAVPDR